MAEIVEFVNRGASSITPSIVDKLLRHLPQWKLEFTQIYEPQYPHLVDRLEFLADSVEDAAEGAYKDLPYAAFARAGAEIGPWIAANERSGCRKVFGGDCPGLAKRMPSTLNSSEQAQLAQT